MVAPGMGALGYGGRSLEPLVPAPAMGAQGM